MDGVVAISDALRSRIIAARPAAAPDVWVEHDGVDLPKHRPSSDRAEARKRLRLTEPSGPIVLYAGRAIAGKGVDILLRAVRLSRTDVQFIVVGKVYESQYLDYAGPNVKFTGFVPPSQVPDYLAAADVLVLPPTGELPYAAYTSRSSCSNIWPRAGRLLPPTSPSFRKFRCGRKRVGLSGA